MFVSSRLQMLRAHLVRGFAEADPATSKVLYHRRNPYMVEVVLNNEKALNSLDSEMIESLAFHVNEWNKDKNIKVVFMRGAGKKAFCAGGDVKSLYDARSKEKDLSKKPEVLDTFFRNEFLTDYKLATMKPLQIALWDGIVMGGGVGISIHAPFRIATENSMFAMPEAKIGFFTDVAGGYFLSRLQNDVGTYLGLTSQRLKGKDLVRAGIANYYIPSEKVPQLEEKLFNHPKPESLTKEQIDYTLKCLSETVEGPLPNIDTIKRVFGMKNIDEVLSELRKAPADDKFSQDTLKLLEGNSPLSLRVIWEQLKRAKSHDLKGAFKEDFRISQHFMGGTEFFEGIRCLLVDRKDIPKWQFKANKDISDAEVTKYFQAFADKSKELAI